MAEDFNSKVLAAANAYLTNHGGTARTDVNDAVVAALQAYSSTPSSNDLNGLVVKSCQQYLSSTDSYSFNDLTMRFLYSYLTAHSVTPIPIDFNSRVIKASDYYTVNGGTTYAAVDTFEINGVTALDAKTYLAVPYGIDGNGWTAHIVATDTGISPAPDPTKVLVYVGCPGFKNKVAITRWYALRGTKLLMKQATSATYVEDTLYNEPAPAGGKRGWHVMLHMDPAGTAALAAMGRDILPWGDQVYSPTTTLEVTLETGWYASAQAGTVQTPVNNSTVAIPPVEVHPLDFEREYITHATDRTTRFKVSSPFGMNGRMFDAAEVYGTDGTNTSAVTTVSDVTLSSITTGSIYSTICSGTYAHTALTNNTLCQDRIKVWPLIGQAADVFDSSAITDPNDMRFAQYWRKDTNNSYAIPYAVVESGAAGPGVASTTLATAEASPFPSWHLAQIALATVGARGHTGGGIVYGRNLTGADIVLDLAGNMTGVVGDTCMYIRQHPSNTKKLKLGMGNTANRQVPTRIIFDGTDVQRLGNGGAGNAPTASFSAQQSQSGNETLCFQIRNCTVNLDYTGGTSLWTNNFIRLYFEAITFATTGGAPGTPTFGTGFNGTNGYFCKVAHGIYNTTLQNAYLVPYTVLGIRGKFSSPSPLRGSGQPANDGGIMHSCRFEKGSQSVTQFVGSDNAIGARGFHMEQIANDYKVTSKDFSIGGDGTIVSMLNVNVSYMVNPPNPANVNDTTGRNNTGYNDTAGSQGVVKHVREKMSCDGRYAIKTGWFDYTLAGTGRCANWKTWGQVGWGFNVMCYYRDPNVSGSNNPEWAGAFRSTGSKYPPTSAGYVPTYTSNLNVDGTDTPSDLQPTGTLDTDNPMFVNLPAGWQTIKYDMKGSTRRDAGNFPSTGPIERSA